MCMSNIRRFYIFPVPAANSIHLHVCRLLYNSCRAKSAKEIKNSMDSIQSFLLEEMGPAEYVQAYEVVRNALALGKDFSTLKKITQDSLKELFPLVIQLIQMQCCTTLWLVYSKKKIYHQGWLVINSFFGIYFCMCNFGSSIVSYFTSSTQELQLNFDATYLLFLLFRV